MIIRPQYIVFPVIIIVLICIVIHERFSQNERENALITRQLAVLCNSVIGYYENNDAFPDDITMLDKDPKGKKWGGEFFRATTDGVPIQLIKTGASSVDIRIKDRNGSLRTTNKWMYTLHVETVTPTNHVWRILIINAPDKSEAFQAITKRGMLETVDWISPKREIRYKIEAK